MVQSPWIVNVRKKTQYKIYLLYGHIDLTQMSWTPAPRVMKFTFNIGRKLHEYHSLLFSLNFPSVKRENNTFSLYRHSVSCFKISIPDSGTMNFKILLPGFMDTITMHLVFLNMCGTRDFLNLSWWIRKKE